MTKKWYSIFVFGPFLKPKHIRYSVFSQNFHFELFLHYSISLDRIALFHKQWEGIEEDPVLEEKLLDWLLHKDTHEDSKLSLDDLTIY